MDVKRTHKANCCPYILLLLCLLLAEKAFNDVHCSKSKQPRNDYQNFYQNIPIFKAKVSYQLDYCFQSLHIIILVQYEIEYDQFLGGLVGDCL